MGTSMGSIPLSGFTPNYRRMAELPWFLVAPGALHDGHICNQLDPNSSSLDSHQCQPRLSSTNAGCMSRGRNYDTIIFSAMRLPSFLLLAFDAN